MDKNSSAAGKAAETSFRPLDGGNSPYGIFVMEAGLKDLVLCYNKFISSVTVKLFSLQTIYSRMTFFGRNSEKGKIKAFLLKEVCYYHGFL